MNWSSGCRCNGSYTQHIFQFMWCRQMRQRFVADARRVATKDVLIAINFQLNLLEANEIKTYENMSMWQPGSEWANLCAVCVRVRWLCSRWIFVFVSMSNKLNNMIDFEFSCVRCMCVCFVFNDAVVVVAAAVLIFSLPQMFASILFRGLFRANLGVAFLPHLIINRYTRTHTLTRAHACDCRFFFMVF